MINDRNKIKRNKNFSDGLIKCLQNDKYEFIDSMFKWN